jgi:hypothetical protein
MNSITLIHPEATLTIPVIQAIKKCSLFRNNLTLTASPYRIESPVSMSIFQEFVSAFERKTVTITNTNFTEFDLLSKEFGFTELSAQHYKVCESSSNWQSRQIGNRFVAMQNTHLSESFLFVVNGSVIESDFAESAAFFPAVREQLLVDGCARTFFLNESRISAADIRSLQLLLSGEDISNVGSEGLLSKLLGNANLEFLFLDRLKANNRMNLSDLMIERRIDLE